MASRILPRARLAFDFVVSLGAFFLFFAAVLIFDYRDQRVIVVTAAGAALVLGVNGCCCCSSCRAQKRRKTTLSACAGVLLGVFATIALFSVYFAALLGGGFAGTEWETTDHPLARLYFFWPTLVFGIFAFMCAGIIALDGELENDAVTFTTPKMALPVALPVTDDDAIPVSVRARQ